MYSIDDVWMNEWMNMEHVDSYWWENQSIQRKTCSLWLVHHKSHMDWPGIKPFINRVGVCRNGRKIMIISLMIKIIYQWKAQQIISLIIIIPVINMRSMQDIWMEIKEDV
jgi:hypothetical protein